MDRPSLSVSFRSGQLPLQNCDTALAPISNVIPIVSIQPLATLSLFINVLISLYIQLFSVQPYLCTHAFYNIVNLSQNFFVKQSGRLSLVSMHSSLGQGFSLSQNVLSSNRDNYMETLAIVSNDPYVRSESIVPTETCSILVSQMRDKRFCDRDDPYDRDD